MRALVSISRLPINARFVTALTNRSGRILGPPTGRGGIPVTLSNPVELKCLDPDVVVRVA